MTAALDGFSLSGRAVSDLVDPTQAGVRAR